MSSSHDRLLRLMDARRARGRRVAAHVVRCTRRDFTAEQLAELRAGKCPHEICDFNEVILDGFAAAGVPLFGPEDDYDGIHPRAGCLEPLQPVEAALEVLRRE